MLLYGNLLGRNEHVELGLSSTRPSVISNSERDLRLLTRTLIPKPSKCNGFKAFPPLLIVSRQLEEAAKASAAAFGKRILQTVLAAVPLLHLHHAE